MSNNRIGPCFSIIVLSACILTGLLTGCSYARQTSVSKLAEQLSRTSVEILSGKQIVCSGSFVSSDGYVLTCAHFLSGPEMKIGVLSQAFGRYSADLIAVDKGHDLALLKIDTKEKLPFLTVSENEPSPGQILYVIGTPNRRHSLFMKATIASTRPAYEYLTDQDTYLHVYYLEAMTPKGLSGGNWVDEKGQIVGVQSGWINESVIGAEGSYGSGLSFIGSTSAVRRLVDTKTNADTPSIGGILEELWTQADGFQNRFESETEGIVVHQVRPGGPLDNAGLEHEDLITAVNGQKLRYRWDLLDVVRSKKVGDTLTLTYVKPDNKGTGQTTVTLDSLEKNWFGNAKK